MAPIPPSYGKGPSCDLVVEAAPQATSSASPPQRSRVGGAQESRLHPVGRAPARHRGLLRRSHRDHAEHRCAGGARHPFHQCLHAMPDLRAGARGARDRAMGAPDQVVGQRRALSRRSDDLASPAARATAIASCRSASCISARPTTTTASARRSSRCMCSTASAT